MIAFFFFGADGSYGADGSNGANGANGSNGADGADGMFFLFVDFDYLCGLWIICRFFQLLLSLLMPRILSCLLWSL